MKSVAEVQRILRRGGQLAMTNEACGAFFSREKGYEEGGESCIHEHNYRYSSYRRALKEAGFSRAELIPDATFRKGSARSWKLRWVNRVFSLLPAAWNPFWGKQVLFGGPLLLIAEKG